LKLLIYFITNKLREGNRMIRIKTILIFGLALSFIIVGCGQKEEQPEYAEQQVKKETAMKTLICEDIDPTRVSEEFDGTADTIPAAVVTYFSDQAKSLCEGAGCSSGTCKGHWRDIKNEPGSEPGKRKYSAELYCKCE
jgi:hypothetical protein